MNIKNDGVIWNLPKKINKVIPDYKPDAVRICKLIKDSGEVVGYELSNGVKVDKSQAIQMTKSGKISGVVVAINKGNEYLRSLPDESEENNLGNLPSISN